MRKSFKTTSMSEIKIIVNQKRSRAVKICIETSPGMTTSGSDNTPLRESRGESVMLGRQDPGPVSSAREE